MEQRPQTWRELLSSLSMEERKRIVNALGIQNKTMERWIRGQTGHPHPNRMRQLFKVLPARTRALFIEFVQQDPAFSHAANIPLPGISTEIPSAFYSRVLEANVSTSRSLRFTSICQLVLLQAVRQIDPDRLGLYMVILKCTPPAHGKKVQSLCQYFSLGTLPWSTIVEQKSVFLGAESVVGQAVMTHRPFVFQDIHGDGDLDILSVYQNEHPASVVALPIKKNGRIAGCLLVLSTQPNFFTPNRLKIIQQYCHLVVIAIEDDEWYEQQQIELRLMPPLRVQQEYLAQFQKRVSTAIKQAHRDGHPKNWLEAEREVQQRIEAELLEEASPE